VRWMPRGSIGRDHILRSLVMWSLWGPWVYLGACATNAPDDDDINKSQIFLSRRDGRDEDDGLPSPEAVRTEVRQNAEDRKLATGAAESLGSAESEAMDIDAYLAQQSAANVKVLDWEDKRTEQRGRPKLIKPEVVKAIKLGRLGARLEAKRVELEAATEKGEFKIYQVEKGDTLREIAQKLLGSAHRWVEIAKINGIGQDGLIFVGEKIAYPLR
jgi:nucleoid-associated protein YgaU